MTGAEKFSCIYQVDDGYVGGGRPKYFNISESDLEEDMDESALEELFQECMQDHFEQHVSPYQKNMDEFIEWAKQRLQERKP